MKIEIEKNQESNNTMKRRSKFTQLMSLILAGTTGFSVIQAGTAVNFTTSTSKKTTGTIEDALASKPHVTHVTGSLMLADGADLELGAWLGVHVTQVSPLVAAQLGLAAGMGLAVEHVVPKSPADKAGIRKHDVLKQFDDQLLVNSEQFQVLVKSKKIDDSVQFTVIREGQEKKLTATLGKMALKSINFEMKKFKPGETVGWVSEDAVDGIADVLILRDEEDMKHGFHTRIVNIMNKNVTMSDDTGTYVLKTDNGKKYFEATSKNGEVLFDGVIGIDLDITKLPPEVRTKLESLEKTSSVEVDRFKHKPEGASQVKENVEIRIIKKSED